MADFLGASFGFGAQDVGFQAAMSSAIKSVGEISKGITAQLKQGSKLGKMWKGVKSSVDSFNIASIASNMNDLNGNTGNLSNSLESMGVSMAQASKPIIAGMDLTSKEARKMTSRVTGMAIGLNVGAEQVAETLRAIHNAGGPAKEAIDAMAMSERDWVKVTTTTGVTMQDFSAVLGDMTASWGASPKQAGAMLDNIMAIGKKAGIGEHGIKGMKGQLDALGVIFEGLPPGIARTADEIQGLMESTYKLSGAFKVMGSTEEEATALGQDTAKMFAEQAAMIETIMQSGGEQNLEDSDLFKFLTQLGVGSEEAMSIISEGSRDVVGGVTKINDIFAKLGGSSSPQVEHALGQLTKSMGASANGLGFLASSTTVGKDALAEMAGMTVKGAGALKAYGKAAHSSGRTLQESMDLARESFETQFRSIGRADVRGFAKKQMKAYKTMGKELKVLGGDPVWGGLVKKMSIMNQMGAKGVFLSMADDLGLSQERSLELGVGLELAMNTAKQLANEFSPVMEIMGMLGPMGGVAIAGGIASYFLLDESDRKEIFGQFYPVIEQIGEAIKTVWDKIPWDKIEMGFATVWDKVTLYMAKVLESILGKDISEQLGLIEGRKAIERRQVVQAEAKLLKAKEAASLAAAKNAMANSQASGEWSPSDPSMTMAASSDDQIAKAAEKIVRVKELKADVAKMFDRQDTDELIASDARRAVAERGGGWREQQAEYNRVKENTRITRMAADTRAGKEGTGNWFTELPFVGETFRDIKAGSMMGERDSRGSRDIVRARRMDATYKGQDEKKFDIWKTVSSMWEDTSEIETKAEAGGAAIMESLGKGTVEAAPVAIDMTKDVMGWYAKLFGGSLPEEGPFKDGERSLSGGRAIMESFANGMYEAKDFVAETVTMVLDEAVIGTFEAYSLKMEDVAKNKSLLKGVAQKMVQDMGGELKMGSVEIDGVNLDAKQTFEAAMSLPGLASVVAAIASDGHKTRVVLKKIQEDTSGILVKTGTAGSVGGQDGQRTLGNE